MHWLLFRLLTKAVGSSWNLWISLLRKVRGPLRLAMILGALALVLPIVEPPQDCGDFLQKISAILMIVIIGWTSILLTFESVQKYGISLFASAGAAGLILGLAARPVPTNLIAGIQIALAQPIRLEDVVIVEGEWGWIEEIFLTYVVVRIWDLRLLIVPLSYFIEKPLQNWRRESAQIIGAVFWYVDYTIPVDAVRTKLEEVVKASSRWDGKVVNLQVTDTDKNTTTLRGLMSAHFADRLGFAL